MRRLAALAVLALTAGAPVSAQPSDGTLTFRFTGVKAAEGKVVVALFDSEAAFKATRNPIRTATVDAVSPATHVSWTGLKPGRYAAVAYHDRDADGQLDKLPVGLPTEDYGFSNDARGRFGAPRWSAAAFEVKAGSNVQSIAVK